MTEFDANDSIVQKMWDRLRTLVGAKVFKIKNKDDLEKVAKKYKTLSGYQKSGLIKKSNVFQVIKEKKMQTYVKGYIDKQGNAHKGYYKKTSIRWTRKETAKLRIYKQRGRTINQMSYYLGRNPTAIKRKIYKLG